ncbi:MAG: type II secretion system protein [Candidatus Pacebacteria bacterium]|nr:type II secretion system protein [Candidatus Paceibacterota bacterium]MDD2757549.1 type II secretion system protein [Candidatus Paceibacterota bacterium]MDD3283738.1 type II secretion system protein [Candidatus Paceibacterota bacterium]MDD3969872.1 type II secretion system protein [Candidatus Paceibacterota bacterium]MDD4738000.1 type II secretion system protein [Candidatus Paceibacterota bacterium]
MKSNKTTKRNKGFTLVETLVSIALFGMISLILVDILTASIKVQSRIIYSQELLEQSSYVLEYMGSKLRMARTSEGGDCLSENTTYNSTRGGSGLMFVSHDPATDTYLCREFYLDTDGLIKERVSSNESGNFGSSSIIASPSFKIDNLKYEIYNDEPSKQPRVTLILKMHKEEHGGETSKITVQTTVSRRDFAPE